MLEILNGLAIKLVTLTKIMWTPLLYALLVPAFQYLPKPSGPHTIGATSIHLVDTQRSNEPFDARPRELMTHWRFPAAKRSVVGTARAPYMGKNVLVFEKLLAKEFRISKKLAHDLLTFKTHSYNSSKIKLIQTNKPLPVIIISHGLGSFGESQTYIAENLASHGYVVVCIDHTNFSTFSTFPDGHMVWHDQRLTSPQFTSEKELMEFYSQVFPIPQQDIAFVLNELTRINQDPQSQWYHKLDLNNIGFAGHSMGAMAGTEAARLDPRIKALVNLDGWLPGFNSPSPLSIPTLVLLSDKSKLKLMLGTDIFNSFSPKKLAEYYDHVKKEVSIFCKHNPRARWAVIPGASHLAFCDFLLIKWPFTTWVPSRTASWLRQENPYPIIRAVNTKVRKFFDTHLKQK